MEVKSTITIDGKEYSKEEATELYYRLGKELGVKLEILPNIETRIYDFSYRQPSWISPITCSTQEGSI